MSLKRHVDCLEPPAVFTDRHLVSLSPVSPVEFGVDSSWVDSCPVVVLAEELLIHTVL